MKKIELKDKTLKIETCENCPLINYDSNYGMSYDSGYDCSYLDQRIANDGEISKYNKELKKIKEKNNSLFKYEGEIPKNPFTIPCHCPLMDA